MSGSTAPWFVEKFFDASNNPLAGGKIYFYVAGSTTLPKNVYADAALTVPLTQPLVCDASGVAPQYFMESGTYKIVVKTSNDQLVVTRDNVSADSSSGTSTGDHKVMTNATDGIPGYLLDKLISNDNSVLIGVSALGDDTKLTLAMNPASVVDNRVSANGSDASDYLVNKITDSNGTVFSVTGGKVVVPLQNYMPKTGGIFTGVVSVPEIDIGDWAVTTSDTALNFSRSSTQIIGFDDTVTVSKPVLVFGNVSAVNVNLGDLAGHTGFVTTDGSGSVQVTTDVTLDQVKSGSSSDIAGWLDQKIVPGNNISFTTTTDDVNGTVIHVNNTAPDFTPVTGYQITTVPYASHVNIGSSTAVLNLCSVTLTAGLWEVQGQVSVNAIPNGGSGFYFVCSPSITSATIVTDGWDAWTPYSTVQGSMTGTCSPGRFVITGTQTVYMCVRVYGLFTNAMAWGNISAVQIS